MTKLLKISLVVSLLALVAGCTRVSVDNGRPVDTANLADLMNLKSSCACAEDPCGDKGSCSGEDNCKFSEIRMQGLRDMALSIGARGGLYCRSQILNCDLLKKSRADELDQAFNFESLLLPHHVLPPVLVEGRDTLNLAGTKMVRLVDRTYKVVQQAKFVTTAPNWREYLLTRYTKPEQPDRSLLPRNKEEQEFWQYYIKQGWCKGYAQADLIYNENLARLKRDYNGIILYRTLLAKKLISNAQVAERSFGVTGGGESMNVNDRVLTITALPSLKPNSEHWEPVLVDK